MTPKIESIIRNLPPSPGVYQYFNKQGEIIYIGKAKNLYKRVLSYFQGDNLSYKTRLLVKNIADIKTIIVNSESDALLLENNLIKEHQPRYNVRLKDDKTFPWICIRNESFPRLVVTRQYTKDGSEYYGPYTSGKVVRTVSQIIRQLYKLRNCSLDLSPSLIARRKYKICLEYHIGNCAGPCEQLQSEDSYMSSIEEIRSILRGNIAHLISALHSTMRQLAEEYRFEEAQLVKERIANLENYRNKSTIVNPAISNVDVFSICEDEQYGYVNYMNVYQGRIVQVHSVEMVKGVDDTSDDMLLYAMVDIRSRVNSAAREILLPFEPSYLLPSVRFHVPTRGDKLRLLQLSQKNAHYFMMQRTTERQKLSRSNRSNAVLEQMKYDLRLPTLPLHIECFDNSNLFGTNPVAACVVFKNAKPSKKDYRHFHVKTVEGIDDFASMREVITRRYSSLLEENQRLPDLVVIDGGKGQLSAALEAIEALGLRSKLSVVGIAKRLEEIFFPDDPYPLYLDKNSPSLKIIQQLRNEAHRFGISFHRHIREKAQLRSGMLSIPGIGPKSVALLFQQFKSFEGISSAAIEELAACVGMARALVIRDFFHGKAEHSTD